MARGERAAARKRLTDTAIKIRLRRQLDRLGAQLKLTMCSDVLQKPVRTHSSVKKKKRRWEQVFKSHLLPANEQSKKGTLAAAKRQAARQSLSGPARAQPFGSPPHILPSGRIRRRHVPTHLQECGEDGRERTGTFLLLQPRGSVSLGHKPRHISGVGRLSRLMPTLPGSQLFCGLGKNVQRDAGTKTQLRARLTIKATKAPSKRRG